MSDATVGVRLCLCMWAFAVWAKIESATAQTKEKAEATEP